MLTVIQCDNITVPSKRTRRRCGRLLYHHNRFMRVRQWEQSAAGVAGSKV